MKGKDFIQKLQNVDPALVEEAAKPNRVKRSVGFKATVAAAACVCVIGATVLLIPALTPKEPSPYDYSAESHATISAVDISSVSGELYPVDEISYTLYLPDGENGFTKKQITQKLNDGKDSTTPREFFEQYLRESGITGLEFVSLSSTKTDSRTEESGGFSSYYPGISTYTLKLNGESQSEITLKCVVNTLIERYHADYIIIEINGQTVSIDGKSPEKGFAKFYS